MAMRIIDSAQAVRETVDEARRTDKAIGFIPTMGNLHRGHMSLVRSAQGRTDFTVVSIFVNPFQFAKGEDFATYPRTLEADTAKLSAAGVDVLFLPKVESIYPCGPEAITRVEVPGLSSELCGAVRPQFFRGVCTVVNLLLNIVSADVAVFGEKDYQQLIIIKQMVRDLHLLTAIVGSPTVREDDGLAMSSRNAYLSDHQRAQASGLFRTLSALAGRISDEDGDFGELEESAMQTLRDCGFVPDYVSVRRALDLAAPSHGDADLIVLGAVWLGATRLIDNVRVSDPSLDER